MIAKLIAAALLLGGASPAIAARCARRRNASPR